MKLSFILFVALMTPHFCHADDETRAAVQQVQQQMRSPEFHKAAARESAEAKKVEEYVQQLTGNPQNEQELYNLAADVLGNMKDQSPEQMMQTLNKAQSNPESFANSWTPEQKKKLEEISRRLPASQRKNP